MAQRSATDVSRRQVLLRLLFGPGLVGLRSLMTGLPVSWLLAAQSAQAAQPGGKAPDRVLAGGARAPQFVVFSTSIFGDPINCNAPGCYDDPAITHSADPAMAATPVSLGQQSSKAAKVWASLPASMLGQASFFHHATYTVVHPDQTKVLKLQGATRNAEMLPSLLSQNLAAPLATLRDAPIDFNTFANGAITSAGVLQPSLTPSSLASLLALPGDGLGDASLLTMRDKTVDKVNAWVKGQGQAFQGEVIDAYAVSRAQARALQDSVVSALQAIKGDDALSQLRAAVLLFQMKVTPVVLTNLSFGGDNHVDANLAGELAAHKDAIATLGKLPALVSAAGLERQVTFCSLNVFGRKLTEANGRGHHDGHAVSLIVGDNVRAGVVGGIGAPSSATPYVARAIDSASGKPSDGGDVPYAETLAAYAKTLCAAVGLPDEVTQAAITRGKVVAGALNS